MEDYPRTAADFEVRFRSEQACREYLFQLRWPEGFRCPRCGSAKAWPLRSVLRQCAGCGRQVSLTAGTVFQDTHTPLTVWFQAMWWVLPACPAGGGRRTNNLRINRSKHRGETTTGRGHLSQVDTHIDLFTRPPNHAPTATRRFNSFNRFITSLAPRPK